MAGTTHIIMAASDGRDLNPSPAEPRYVLPLQTM